MPWPPCASASARASPWCWSASDAGGSGHPPPSAPRAGAPAARRRKGECLMFVQLGDITAHAQVEGPATGEPVLLLHSLGTTLHMWDPQAAALARRGFRVIRPDMRGHGLTEAPPGPY